MRRTFQTISGAVKEKLDVRGTIIDWDFAYIRLSQNVDIIRNYMVNIITTLLLTRFTNTQ